MFKKRIVIVSALAMIVVGGKQGYPWGGTLTITHGSIDCGAIITGGSNQKDFDGAFACAVRPRQIVYQCFNKKGNSGNAESANFDETTEPVQTLQGFDDHIVATKNGKQSGSVFFSDDDIRQAIESAINLDPAELCRNHNWQLRWVLSRFDLSAVISQVVNGWVPTWTSPDDAFDGCDPSVSSLTYTDGTTSDDTKGQIDECYVFTDYAAQLPLFPGTDTGGVAYASPFVDVHPYGLCAEHAHQTGSFGTLPYGYNVWGPAVTDCKCPLVPILLDGSSCP